MKNPNFGLNPTPEDPRDFSLGGYDPLPQLDELPSEFRLPFIVKNQGSTDWCSAYASCAASEVQENTELEPGYSFAASKDLTGDPESWGQNLRSACDAHRKYGALAIKDFHADVSGDKRLFDTWKSYYPVAQNHKKKSYFKITGPYSDFDNIRAALFKYKTPIVIGIQFGYNLKDKYLRQPKEGFGHALAIIGFTTYDDGEPVLIVGNSYGKEAGDNGVHYIHKDVINHWAPLYGAYTFIDADPEVVKHNALYNIHASDNWIVQLWKTLTTFLTALYK